VGRIEKWNDAMLRNWAAVLRAVPGSRFRIIGLGYDDAEFRRHVLERLTRSGIEAARVELVGRKPFVEYLAEVSAIDLLLDTAPFNGHTTTLQALYMGVPTVTLAGRAHRSRMGASVMTALGLGELVAESPEAFLRIAADLARRPDRLTELRHTLRERLLGSSLCDARAFEGLLLEAWNRKLKEPA
jgi:predicted O-linked N-acetylglucosamine transferase (SPINDLY family)